MSPVNVRVRRGERNVIGRKVAIEVDHNYHQGKVIDSDGENHAKRVRIYTPGPMEGRVVIPGQYVIMEFLD